MAAAACCKIRQIQRDKSCLLLREWAADQITLVERIRPRPMELIFSHNALEIASSHLCSMLGGWMSVAWRGTQKEPHIAKNSLRGRRQRSRGDMMRALLSGSEFRLLKEAGDADACGP